MGKPACCAIRHRATVKHSRRWKNRRPTVGTAKLHVTMSATNWVPGMTVPGATWRSTIGCSEATTMSDAILVLGANGFVGQSLTKSLARQGVPVIAVSRGGACIEHKLIESVVGDFREPEQFELLLERSRAVVHLATTSTPGTSAGSPLHEIETNLHLTAALLQALHGHPQVELLYMSSGGSLYADTTTEPSRESAPLQPRSYHGAAKLAAETFISAWCHQAGGRATILRPSNVY